MSRDGVVSRRAATVNPGGTPTVALLLSTVVALLFIVFGRTFEKVVTLLAFFFVANYTLSFISVFVLRRREPDRPRPYRVWGYPWTTAMALLARWLSWREPWPVTPKIVCTHCCCWRPATDVPHDSMVRAR